MHILSDTATIYTLTPNIEDNYTESVFDSIRPFVSKIITANHRHDIDVITGSQLHVYICIRNTVSYIT